MAVTDYILRQFMTIATKYSRAIIEKTMKYYSYFFTRQDLYKEYQLVQTAHVALELGNRLRPDQVENLHFSCCGVENLAELKRVQRDLEKLGHEYVIFFEDDINEETAIGVYPIADNDRGLLKNERLLRFKD